MWGSLNGSMAICGYNIELEKIKGGLCRYKRLNDENCIQVARIVPCDSLEIWPLPPIFYPEKVTSYVMVKFSEPITVRSGETVKLSVYVAFDIGVMVENHIIDVFPSNGESKYALYGSPTRGLLVRYLKADMRLDNSSESLRLAAGDCKALLELYISNRFNNPVSVSRVVFPSIPVKLEVKNNIPLYPPIRMVITSSYTAVVNVMMQTSHLPGRLLPSQRSISIVMNHGF
jgi:hypothetical protein